MGLKIQQVAQAVNISEIRLTAERGRKENQPCLFYKTKSLVQTRWRASPLPAFLCLFLPSFKFLLKCWMCYFWHMGFSSGNSKCGFVLSWNIKAVPLQLLARLHNVANELGAYKILPMKCWHSKEQTSCTEWATQEGPYPVMNRAASECKHLDKKVSSIMVVFFVRGGNTVDMTSHSDWNNTKRIIVILAEFCQNMSGNAVNARVHWPFVLQSEHRNGLKEILWV